MVRRRKYNGLPAISFALSLQSGKKKKRTTLLKIRYGNRMKIRLFIIIYLTVTLIILYYLVIVE